MFSVMDAGTLARALRLPIDLRLKQLLIERRDQHGSDFSDVRFVIVQAGDSMKALEHELGWSVFENGTDGRRFGDPEFSPSFEWVACHSGPIFELIFVWTDDFTHAVFVDASSSGVDLELLRLCEIYVTDEV